MIKLLSSLLGAVAGAFALALFITLNVYLTPFLGAWMILVDAVLLLGALVFVSYMAEASIPLVRTLLRRAYFRVKFKADKANKLSKAQTIYLKILASLIMLFKSADDGFELIKDEAHIVYEKSILFLDKERKKGKEVFVQLKVIHRNKQRRAATVSALAVMLFVMGSVLTALFSSLMYPNIFQSQAATYTWTQTSWSGGTSTAVAVHPGDQSGWTNYLSADSNIVIDGSGNITMGSGVQDVVETNTSDFQKGNITNDTQSHLIVEGDEIKINPGISSCGTGNYYYFGSMSWADCAAIAAATGGTTATCPWTDGKCTENFNSGIGWQNWSMQADNWLIKHFYYRNQDCQIYNGAPWNITFSDCVLHIQ